MFRIRGLMGTAASPALSEAEGAVQRSDALVREPPQPFSFPRNMDRD
jgi:hypothetical protein